MDGKASLGMGVDILSQISTTLTERYEVTSCSAFAYASFVVVAIIIIPSIHVNSELLSQERAVSETAMCAISLSSVCMGEIWSFV